jgi:hypothetical protein
MSDYPSYVSLAMTIPGRKDSSLRYNYQIGNPPGLIIKNVCSETFIFAYGITRRQFADAQTSVKFVSNKPWLLCLYSQLLRERSMRMLLTMMIHLWISGCIAVCAGNSNRLRWGKDSERRISILLKWLMNSGFVKC